MTNKEIAKSFLKLAGKGDVDQAFNQYVAADFYHHNQYFEGSAQALKKAMQTAHETAPNKLIEIKHCYVDGETVVTHSLVVKATMEIAVIHIFRFKNNKIMELWDIGEAIDKNSPNKHGLF